MIGERRGYLWKCKLHAEQQVMWNTRFGDGELMSHCKHHISCKCRYCPSKTEMGNRDSTNLNLGTTEDTATRLNDQIRIALWQYIYLYVWTWPLPIFVSSIQAAMCVCLPPLVRHFQIITKLTTYQLILSLWHLPHS